MTIYLRSISLKDKSADLPSATFPFNLPIMCTLEDLNFTAPITLLVGENGSGKSTLLEAIACGLNCPTVGISDVSDDPSLKAQQQLAHLLRFSRSKNPARKLFFRAEDAIGYTRRVRDDLEQLATLEKHFEASLDGYGKQLATGAMRGQKNALTHKYGDNPDAHSHGEWFINLLKQRIHPGGLYLLDEPETPLSPIHQLSLMSLILDGVEQNCQFIIATHSPMVMALPRASILSFDHQPVREIEWQDIEHVAIMRSFLNDPESYLRHL